MYGIELKQSPPIIASSGDDFAITDTFSRSITYLRISLTDQCNLRCLYCTPRDTQDKLKSVELLTYEELLRVASLAVSMGIRKIRLTGGEVLVRRNAISFIKELASIPGLEDIRLTTNGVLLEEFAEDFFEAGIRKINISLDTLQRERFLAITGFDRFDKVWNGITLVKKLGFSPIKINVVALRGINDDELLDFAKLTLKEPFQVRFIEFMPIGSNSVWGEDKYISADEIKSMLLSLGTLKEIKSKKMDGPARNYRFRDSVGSVGFISPISSHFCEKCNRLRLTAEGKLRSCLLSDKETDLKSLLRSGCSDEEVKKALLETIRSKPKGHALSESNRGNCHGQMSRIGG